jgi:hypothetical protein
MSAHFQEGVSVMSGAIVPLAELGIPKEGMTDTEYTNLQEAVDLSIASTLITGNFLNTLLLQSIIKEVVDSR